MGELPVATQHRRIGPLADRIGDQPGAAPRELGRVGGLDDQGVGHRGAEDTTEDRMTRSW